MIPEKLITLVQLLRESETLRAWHQNLCHMPDAQRGVTIQLMAEQIRAGGEDPELVEAILSLANPQIFAAVSKTLRDMG
jgi:hypothetical protein